MDQDRIDYLDGLRAVAVLTVLVAHVALHAHGSGLAAHIAKEGAHGVDLFFVLSGFCLAYPTLRKIRREKIAFRLADFGAKRVVRIVPPFYIATVGLLAAALLMRASGHDSTFALPPAADVVKSLLFIDSHVQLVNDSFWTLMVEFRWYFAFPVLLAVWVRSPRAFCAIGFASALLYGVTRAHGLDLGTLPGFMLGIIAADVSAGARVTGETAALLKRFALPLACVCAAWGIAVESRATIPGFDGSDVLFAYQPTIVGWQLATFFVVVAAGASGWLRRILSARALVATGVASYSIYLVHEPVIAAIVAHVHGPLGDAVAAAVALACGFAFWALAERPFTTGPLRKPLLAAVAEPVRRAFTALGVPLALPLQVPSDRRVARPVNEQVPFGPAAASS